MTPGSETLIRTWTLRNALAREAYLDEQYRTQNDLCLNRGCHRKRQRDRLVCGKCGRTGGLRDFLDGFPNLPFNRYSKDRRTCT